jgi:3-(3-hydroxy-phenyl)propionate hydroxylase
MSAFKNTPPTERHTWIEAPFNDNRAVWQHLMGDDVWRIDYQMAAHADPAYVSREDVVRERLAKQIRPDVDCELVWVGPYAYKSQCLHRASPRPCVSCGDTAKVVSPFGARGGDAGIADADNLAWKLAAVVRGQAPAVLLNSYHQERLQAAQRNVQVTNRTGALLAGTRGHRAACFAVPPSALAKRHAFARHAASTPDAWPRPIATTPLRVCQAEGGFMVQNIGLQFTPQHTGCLSDLLVWADGYLLLLVFGTLSGHAFKTTASTQRYWLCEGGSGA